MAAKPVVGKTPTRCGIAVWTALDDHGVRSARQLFRVDVIGNITLHLGKTAQVPVPVSMVRSPQSEGNTIATERHYSVFEVAEMWNVSSETIRRLFHNEPGVLIFGSAETRYKRNRETMRIPASIVERVHEHHHRRAA